MYKPAMRPLGLRDDGCVDMWITAWAKTWTLRDMNLRSLNEVRGARDGVERLALDECIEVVVAPTSRQRA